MKFVQIGTEKVCVKGVGKMFYQDGFPISLCVSELHKRGVKVSILHVADECLKNGWSADTILTKFKEDFADIGEKLDMVILKSFCYASYEDQREMIFKSLFKCSSQDVINEINTNPLNFLRSTLMQ